MYIILLVEISQSVLSAVVVDEGSCMGYDTIAIKKRWNPLDLGGIIGLVS
jgi:hypothetical protein